ncbi:unnamed protein product [Heterobilharzia americana]|nr:unnamed protein product [Heterobilharzia americana]
MKQENLVTLIGVILIPPLLTLYTEFCDRGSLCFVLRRDSIPLNWSLRFRNNCHEDFSLIQVDFL